jgi:hypothetical protein
MSEFGKRPYQNEYIKNSKPGNNIFKKRQDMVLEKDISEEKEKQWMLWITFWRRNIFWFIIDVMGINLFPFQIIWIYLMQESPFFVGICSRTASKSFLVAVFTVARSILYPGLITIVAATTKEQSGRMISEKIQYLYDTSIICQTEIDKLVHNNNTYECVFFNKSRIKVVAANEGALGSRCNDLVIDEYVMLDKDIVDKILKPFLFPRQVPYTKLPEYSKCIEPIRTYYISSAWYTTEWWYKTALNAAKGMIEGKGSGFFATDFQSSIRHNLKTVEQIEDEKRDNAAFDMQYGNIPGNSNEDSYYQIGMFKRTIKKAFYPLRRIDYALKKNPFSIPRIENEIRIMGIDIATRKSKSNDNSVTCCIRLLPSKKGYERHMVYMESSHGANHSVQAQRIKDIWYDFNADYIAMDIANVGSSVYEDLGLPYYNEERGIQIPAFTVMEIAEIDQKVREELREKTLGANPLANIFPISGTASLNTDIHVAFRSSLQKKLWQFLVSDMEGEDFLIENTKEYFDKNDEFSRVFLIHPYTQTGLFISEAISLKAQFINTNIKLTEGTGRKDRYSAVSYANLLCSIFDKDLLRETPDDDDFQYLLSLVQSV